MITFAARGHDLDNVHDFATLAKEARRQEIDFVQLALGRSFPDLPSDAQHMNPGLALSVRQSLAKEGVGVGILSCYINMIHPDPAVRENLIQKFQSYIRYAHLFGAGMVASETGSVIPQQGYSEVNFTDETFADLLEVIKRLVKEGEAYQTIVGIEPGLNHPLYSIERVKQLVAAIPSKELGIILDPTNLITAETYLHQVEMVQEAFESFGDKIVALHLKDFRIEEGKVLPCNLGEGIIQAEKILAIVKAYKPHCLVVMEETKGDALGRAVKKFA